MTAAIVVPAGPAVAIVVPTGAAAIPAVRTAAIPARTTDMAVETVRVAAPNWIPEVTGTPLREWTRLSLCHGGGFYADKAQARRNYQCRYCNASNVFHLQCLPTRLHDPTMRVTLISLRNARVITVR